MKILHIVTGLESGGAEHSLCRLVETLDTEQFSQHVIVLGAEGSLSARMRHSASSLAHLGVSPNFPNPLLILRLSRIIKSIRPHLIHGWMYHGNIVATLAGRHACVPVIWCVRQSLYDLNEEKRATRTVIKVGARLSDRPKSIVYNAKISAIQHERIGYCDDRRCIIPNGFDTDIFRPHYDYRIQVREELGISRDAFVVGLVARWHPVKDHENFLRAARILAQRVPEAVFLMVGEGVDNNNTQLVGMVNYLGLRNRVWLCGNRDDMALVNAALDVASLSSTAEAFPNAIGEAMACGVPCVATDVGDVRAILGLTGFTVPSRDPHSLYSGWMELAEMGALARRKLGDRARKRIISRYPISSVGDRYTALYRQVKVA